MTIIMLLLTATGTATATVLPSETKPVQCVVTKDGKHCDY